MEFTPLFNWSLAVLVVVLALQNIFLAVAMLIGRFQLARVFSRGRENVDRLRDFLNTVEKNLIRVSALLDRVPEWGTQVQEAAAGASRAVAEVDEKLEKAFSYIQTGVRRWQDQSDQLLSKCSKTSAAVYGAVLEPASRVSLLLRAAGAFLGRLFAGSEADEDPSHYHQDQETFI